LAITEKKLLFGPGGLPKSYGDIDVPAGIEICAELGLGCMELEYVYGVRVTPAQAQMTRLAAEKHNIKLSAHAPYYINLNSKDGKKEEASVARILASARAASASGADRVVFHAAFMLDADPEDVYYKVKKHLQEIRAIMKSESLSHVELRPELTGKLSQFGNLDELIRLSRDVEGVLPCVDFSHYYARYAGHYNSYDNFCDVLERVGDELGDAALKNMHIHLSGIEITAKGEKRHVQAEESRFNYLDVLEALKSFGVAGRVIAESPINDADAILFQEKYRGIKAKKPSKQADNL